MSLNVGKKLLRSVLFCPGNSKKVLSKTASLRPDAFIYDLEDAVTAQAKEVARDTLSEFFAESRGQTDRTVAVRVNCPLGTAWGADDLKRFADLKQINAFVIPKVESFDVIEATLSIVRERRPAEHGPVSVWAMVETARGVLNADAIASHAAVEALVFGSNDLTKDIRAVHVKDRSPLLFSMSKCILAARAEGKFVIDGVYNDIKDEVGFRESCAVGRNMGFDGRSLIHPSQIDSSNAAYSPSESDIDLARRVIQAWESAVAEGKTVAVVDGRLVEELHVHEARAALDFAEKCGLAY